MNSMRNDGLVRAAVVGLGRGRAHVQALLRAEGVKLVAVCDKNKDAADKIASEHNLDVYTDLGDMLKRDDIDLVHVCTPSGLHSEMLLQIAEAGKHAITEKPLDITLEKIDKAIEAFETRNLHLGCIFQARFTPTVQKIKQAVSEGRLGKIVLANAHVKWYRSQKYYEQSGGWRGTWKWDGGGSLMNQSVHMIDILQWIVGPVRSIFGRTQVSTHQIETEDLGVALVEFSGGAFGTIIGTTSAYPGFGMTVEIFGERGGITMKDNKITAWKIQGEHMEAEEAEMIGFSDAESAAEDSTFLQIQDMIDAVRYNRPPRVTGKEGRDAVEIVLSVYESARTGQAVHLN